MLLMWGEQPVMVYNEAYAALIGLPSAARARRQGAVHAAGRVELAAAALAPARAGRSLSYRGAPAGLAQRPDGAGAGPVLHPGARWRSVAGIVCTWRRPALRLPQATTRRCGCWWSRTIPTPATWSAKPCARSVATVEATATGEEALPLLAGQPYDVLFTDVSLPGMSGVELARLPAPAAGAGVAVCLRLWRRAHAWSRIPARSLQKPYDIEQLQAVLEQIAGAMRAPERRCPAVNRAEPAPGWR
jgi:CheY-like chemotaxis protein